MMTLLLEKTNTDVIIRIPKEYWNKTDMVDSSEVKIDFANYGIEVVDISVKTWTLDELLGGYPMNDAIQAYHKLTELELLEKEF